MSEEQRPWPEPAWRIEAEQAEKQARAELRDRFAMAALTGLLANPSLERMPEDVWASDAYIFADAMLKARDNKSTDQ